MPVVNLAASSFSTTGTISAGSAALTVADASGFAIGDYLVIEIGNEAGAGARGTVGVGGTWPNLAYATLAAMTAVTTKPDGQYAYVQTSGNVYRSFSGAWTPENPTTQYYTAKVIPRSLAARVTAKVGSVLTLSVTATVAASNARVWFDNFPVFDAHALDADGTELVWPTGDFALSDMCWAQGKSNWYIHGTSRDDTKLFFPKGIAANALINFSGAGSGNRVGSICVQGNALAQGYMIGWAPGVGEVTAKYHTGISFNSQTGGIISDTRSINVFQYGAGVSFCANSSIYRHEAIHTEGLLQYIQWQVGGADCAGGELVDCRVISEKLTAGIEWFRSTDVVITNYTGVNATMSINTCNDWTISAPSVTVQAGSYVNDVAFHRNNPMIIASKAIGGIDIDAGGVIADAILVVEGYVNANNNVTRGILIEDPVPNITIRRGSYVAPDHAEPVPSALPGPVGIVSGAVNTSVSCFTSYGQIEAGTASVNRANIGIANGSISYCRAGSIFPTTTTANVTVTGNGLTTDPLPLACYVSTTNQVVYISFAATPTAPVDPYLSNVVLLVSGIGSNGATSIPDISDHYWGNGTITGGTTLSTSSPVSGFSSSILTTGAAGGSTDHIKWQLAGTTLQTPSPANAVWTIELVWKPSAAGSVCGWGYTEWGGAGSYGGFIQNSSDGSFRCYNGFPAGIVGFDFSTGIGHWAAGNEYFLVLESNGSKMRLYLGTLGSGSIAPIASTTTVGGANPRALAMEYFFLSYFGFANQSAGKFNWLRVTNGVARYNTDSATAIPTFPFPYTPATVSSAAGTASGTGSAAAVGSSVTGGGEAAAFLARTTGLDGTHTTAYTNLIDGLVADGIWSKLDMLHIYATQDSTTANLNLIGNIYNATPTNSPTFTADRGYTGLTAGNKLVRTGFIPSTAVSPKFVQDLAHVSIWTLTAASSFGAFIMGCTGVSNTGIHAQFGDGNAYVYANSTGNVGAAVGTSAGHTLANRSSSTGMQGYKDGALLVSTTNASAAVNAREIIVAGQDQNGTLIGSGYQVCMASIGSSLNATEAGNLYTRLRTYMTAVGVP